ncbi:hypothetical protein J6590_008466 [Homalodisca vitripennis]|nr:hypothetical protein J6590_008466 [Homalodisca vitripennis]
MTPLTSRPYFGPDLCSQPARLGHANLLGPVRAPPCLGLGPRPRVKQLDSTSVTPPSVNRCYNGLYKLGNSFTRSSDMERLTNRIQNLRRYKYNEHSTEFGYKLCNITGVSSLQAHKLTRESRSMSAEIESEYASETRSTKRVKCRPQINIHESTFSGSEWRGFLQTCTNEFRRLSLQFSCTYKPVIVGSMGRYADGIGNRPYPLYHYCVVTVVDVSVYLARPPVLGSGQPCAEFSNFTVISAVLYDYSLCVHTVGRRYSTLRPPIQYVTVSLTPCSDSCPLITVYLPPSSLLYLPITVCVYGRPPVQYVTLSPLFWWLVLCGVDHFTSPTVISVFLSDLFPPRLIIQDVLSSDNKIPGLSAATYLSLSSRTGSARPGPPAHCLQICLFVRRDVARRYIRSGKRDINSNPRAHGLYAPLLS